MTQPDANTPWTRSEQRGSYAMLTGLMIATLVGLSAFSVDVSLITMAELQAQSTADAASHAALVAYRTAGGGATGIAAGNGAATWMTAHDKVAMGYANLDNVTFGRWDYTVGAFSPGGNTINAAQASVSRTAANNNAVDLLLAPLLGVNTYDVAATAITAEQLRAMMLVMDMSCSMMTGSVTGNSPVNLGRAANYGFYQYMVTHPISGDLLGLSMFAQYANRYPNAPGFANTPSGSRVTASVPNRVADPPWLPLSLISTNGALIAQRINGICDTGVAYNTYCVTGAVHPTTATVGSTTNHAPAMYQAINELTDTSKVNATYFKGMLVFSDGLPNPSTLAPNGVAAADLAWQNDIYIWTVYYAQQAGGIAYMQSLVRGAPTAFAQTSQNAADLPAMYQAVAKSLPTALVF